MLVPEPAVNACDAVKDVLWGPVCTNLCMHLHACACVSSHVVQADARAPMYVGIAVCPWTCMRVLMEFLWVYVLVDTGFSAYSEEIFCSSATSSYLQV